MPARSSRRSQSTDSKKASRSTSGGASRGRTTSQASKDQGDVDATDESSQPLTAYASELRAAESSRRIAAKGSAKSRKSSATSSKGSAKSRKSSAASSKGSAKSRKSSAASSKGAARKASARQSSPPKATKPKPVDLGPLGPIGTDLPMEQRPEEVLRLAREAFAKTGSWVVFYRWMLGPEGVVDKLYPASFLRQYFETTEAFAELLEMVTSIRSQDDSKAGVYEPDRMITVRLPCSMHDAVIRDADALDLSINKYCLTKLLQPTNKRFTPLEPGARRGRRPGPQIVVSRIQTDAKP